MKMQAEELDNLKKLVGKSAPKRRGSGDTRTPPAQIIHGDDLGTSQSAAAAAASGMPVARRRWQNADNGEPTAAGNGVQEDPITPTEKKKKPPLRL